MNERIQQLALEAFQPINDVTSEGVADRRTFDQAWFQHYNQNFAELIVRECIAQAVKEEERYDSLDERDCDYCSMAMANFQGVLAKHFGVEE